MQQWWFDDGLGLKSVIYGVIFYVFPLILRFSLIFMNIKNYVICIAGHGITGICLTFKLVPRLVVYDKYQLRYDCICMYTPINKNHIYGLP